MIASALSVGVVAALPGALALLMIVALALSGGWYSARHWDTAPWPWSAAGLGLLLLFGLWLLGVL